MFRRSVGGLSLFAVCLCSIGLQLPTQVGTSTFFGVFGAEMGPSTEIPCNAIAPKIRNCRDLDPNCINKKYIAGPQSADVGGVNDRRFVKSGTWIECANLKDGQPSLKVETYKEMAGKCKKMFVPYHTK